MAHDKTSSVKKFSGLALAAAAAIAFTTAPLSAANAADEAKVKCEGVNACKGTSDCKTAKHECKGMNNCKGEGVSQMTKAECEAAKAKAKS